MATTTLLNVPNRTYQAGTTTSPTYTVPAGITTITAAFTIAAVDAADSTKAMDFECDRFNADTHQWVFDHGFHWQGGQINPKTGLPYQPAITVDGLVAGVQLRASIILVSVLTAALVVTAQ